MNDPVYTDPDAQDALLRYRERYTRFARSPDALGWRARTQDIRFAAFFDGFAVHSPASILDVGCGFGDLLGFLRSRHWQGRYLGVDLVPEFIREAEQRFASDGDASFACMDFAEQGTDFRFEAAFAAGVLNHRRREGHMEHVARFVQAMSTVGTRYVAVDFLSATADRRVPDLYYHDAPQILALGLSLSKRAQLDHSYMPYEFMLKIWFPDTTPGDFPAFGNPGSKVV